MAKSAILLGATGLVGNYVLKELIEDKTYDSIKIFTRTSTGIKHDKIEEHVVDLLKLEAEKSKFVGDDIFCCIGTTKSKTPNKNAYREIDYGIPVMASKLAGENNASKFLVISALGANRDSKVFYNKVKGEMERDIQFYNAHDTYIFQPSLIGGKRDEKRFGESLAKGLFHIINPIIPQKFKAIHAKTIAKAMCHVAKNGYKDKRITSDVIRTLAKND